MSFFARFVGIALCPLRTCAGMVCHWYVTMASGKTAHLPSEVFHPKGRVVLKVGRIG